MCATNIYKQIVVLIRSHQFSRRNLAPGFRSFSMVRHPCERFISAFTYTLTRAPEPELAWHHKSPGSSYELKVGFSKILQALQSQLRNIGSRNVTAYVASSDFGGAKAASEATFGRVLRNKLFVAQLVALLVALFQCQPTFI